ncbi:MAG: hypothetical protein ACNYVW_07875 [Methanosarcinales archaeon]
MSTLTDASGFIAWVTRLGTLVEKKGIRKRINNELHQYWYSDEEEHIEEIHLAEYAHYNL